jgi:hypothetical protein
VNRIELTLTVARGRWVDRPYWVRLVAFTLILAAILDKNRSRKQPKGRLG